MLLLVDLKSGVSLSILQSSRSDFSCKTVKFCKFFFFFFFFHVPKLQLLVFDGKKFSLNLFCLTDSTGVFMLDIISNSLGAFMGITCDSYLLFQGETNLSNGVRTFLYLLGLAYCFIGLSAITSKFFHSMENMMRQTKKVEGIDPDSNLLVVKEEKLWNYTIADISLLAFGTSFPQISLATIDAIRNIGQLTAGGIFFSLPDWIQ